MDDATLTRDGLAANGTGRILLLACGALAREILALRSANGWQHMDLACLPAILHNHPEQIPDRVAEAVARHRDAYETIFVVYADCGTGGLLSEKCKELGVEMVQGPHCYSFFEGNDRFLKRSEDEFTAFYLTDFLVPGPHCYSFFEGNDRFLKRSEDEFTAFYLTDFLVRQFDAFVTKPLGLDRHPELRDTYFGNYEKLVYQAQTDDPDLTERAMQCADALGLAFERRFTGYGDLETALAGIAK